MRLAVVSSRFPDQPTEAYLGTELEALRPHLEHLVVIPAVHTKILVGDYHGHVERFPFFGPRTLGGAFAALVHRPRASLSALVQLLRCPGIRPAQRLKNLAVYPKGLAVGMLAVRDRIDHLHAYWLSTPSTIAMIAAQVAGIPWSATGHRWDIYDDNAIAVKADAASAIRTISQMGCEAVRERVEGSARNRVTVIPLGVRIPPAAAQSADRTSFNLLCAAELLPVKGHGVLLEAIARARAQGFDIRAVLAGEGPLRDDLSASIERLGLTGMVVLEGQVAHRALLARLQRGEFDAVVLASIEQGDLKEGIPVTLIEAMAAGVPVIATDSGGIPELIDSSRGILVRQGDPEALAQALIAAAVDPLGRRRRIDAARAFAIARYDVRSTARRLLDEIIDAPEAHRSHDAA